MGNALKNLMNLLINRNKQRIFFVFLGLVLGFVTLRSTPCQAGALMDLEPALSVAFGTQLEGASEVQVENQVINQAKYIEDMYWEMLDQGFKFLPETEEAIFKLLDQMESAQKRPGLVKRVLRAIGKFFVSTGKTVVRGVAFAGNVAFDIVATPFFFGAGLAQGVGLHLREATNTKEGLAYLTIGAATGIATFILAPGVGFWTLAGVLVSSTLVVAATRSPVPTFLPKFVNCTTSNEFEWDWEQRLLCNGTEKLHSVFLKVFSTPGKVVGKVVSFPFKAIVSLFK